MGKQLDSFEPGAGPQEVAFSEALFAGLPGDLEALNAGVHADLDRQAREQRLLQGHFRYTLPTFPYLFAWTAGDASQVLKIQEEKLDSARESDRGFEEELL